MKLEELINQKNKHGSKYMSQIEAYTLELLSFYLAEQNKPLSTQRTRIKITEDRSYTPDAIAPEGIDDLPGATLIEVKLGYRRDRIEQAYFYLSQAIIKSKEYNSALIIFADSLSEADVSSIKSMWHSICQDKELEVWDKEKLNQITQSNFDFFQIYREICRQPH